MPQAADAHDLRRFVEAQADSHEAALAELRRGRKTGHWMWFVFPQIAGLGQSATARHYAIADAAEARAYLAHPLLGARLVEATQAVVGAPGRSAEQIMGGHRRDQATLVDDAVRRRRRRPIAVRGRARPLLRRRARSRNDPAALIRAAGLYFAQAWTMSALLLMPPSASWVSLASVASSSSSVAWNSVAASFLPSCFAQETSVP